jgi:N-acetylneuraminic acid mutarotase
MPVGWGLEVEMKWSKPEMTGDVPGKRSAHTFTCIKGEDSSKALMFGGCGYGIPAGPNDDLYELELETKEWKKIASDGPSARSDHTASLISDHEVLVFGGFSHKSRLNDAWILNTNTYKWSKAPIEESPENKSPSPRGGHAACIVGKKVRTRTISYYR